MKTIELAQIVGEGKARSAWDKGVQLATMNYLLEICEDWKIEDLPEDWQEFEALWLNGAKTFREASYGGNWLIYDDSIAIMYCTRSELQRTLYGRRRPNKGENWLDVQARAQMQACMRAYHAMKYGKYVD